MSAAVALYLEDTSTNAAQLVEAFVAADDKDVLASYGIVTALLASLAGHASPSDVSGWFVGSLWPEIESDDQRKERVKDVVLDAVWQLDQSLDAGLLPLLQPAPPQQLEEMQVDPLTPTQTRDKLAQTVKSLVVSLFAGDAGILPKNDCLERLETSFLLLPSLALIDPGVNFARMEVRTRTALYYKQQKFNLLREESEGYAKLAVELVSNLGPPHSPETGLAVESDKARSRRAKTVVDAIANLIGNFDLDPDRCLDVVLDMFEDHLLKHWTFFLDLLAESPWAPQERVPISTKGKRKAFDLSLDGETGSWLIAQMLGFKYRSYADANTSVSRNLAYMTAILISSGFVKLADLWPHLSPEDTVMASLDGKYRDDQVALARSVGGGNALAMAGALVDDEAPASSSKTSAKDSAKKTEEIPAVDKPNQKTALVTALLAIGNLDDALFVLAQYPAILAANDGVADLFCRLLLACLQGAYEPASFRTSVGQEAADELCAVRQRYISTTTTSSKAKDTNILPASALTLDPLSEQTFFYPHWQDALLQLESADDACTLLERLLPILSVKIARNPKLWTISLRILEHDLRQSPDPTQAPRFRRWLDLLRSYLLPSLSMLSANAPAALQIWRILSMLSFETRYALYGEWKDACYRKISALSVRKAEAERDAKGILRRLSTENVKQLGKSLAKAVHTNPTIVFAIVINQVQNYENLIAPVTEAARYFTPLGYDVMNYAILDSLSSERSKLKEDGTSIAMWLQGLANFAATFYRRWSAMEPSLPVLLQYILNCLIAGESKVLIVLRDLIGRMAALEPFADLSDAQVMSLAGGPALRKEVYSQTTQIDLTGKKVPTTKALVDAKRRLTDAFRQSQLAGPMLTHVAVQRQACVKDDVQHLKSLGTLFDQCHAVLFQLIEFLSTTFDAQELANVVPTVEELIDSYDVEAAVAFDISRPKLRLATAQFDEQIAQEIKEKQEQAAREKLERERAASEKAAQDEQAAKEKAQSEEKVKDEPGANDEKVEIDDGDAQVKDVEDADAADVKLSAETETVDVQTDAQDVKMEEAAEIAVKKPEEIEVHVNGLAQEEPDASLAGSPWHPGLEDLIASVRPLLSEEAQQTMGSAFFVTFWSLTLSDIVYPKERYDAEVARVLAMQKEILNAPALKPDEKERYATPLVQLVDNLTAEAQKQSTAVKVTAARLARERDHWFPHVDSKKTRLQLVLQIMQNCILPRAKASLPDAVYAYRMVKQLHTLKTPSFHTLLFYDKLLSEQVAPLLFTCTEMEARHFARFFNDVLHDMYRWQADEGKYKAEAIGDKLHGFARQYKADGNYEESDYVSFSTFKLTVQRCHARLSTAFVACFESGEYMHVKNSILVLTKIAKYYPLQHADGVKLESAVNSLLAIEKREDIKILAQGYKAVLNKWKKHWLNAPKPEPKVVPAEAQETGSSAASPRVATAPGTPLPTDAASRATDVAKPMRTAELRGDPKAPVPLSNSSGTATTNGSSAPTTAMTPAERERALQTRLMQSQAKRAAAPASPRRASPPPASQSAAPSLRRSDSSRRDEPEYNSRSKPGSRANSPTRLSDSSSGRNAANRGREAEDVLAASGRTGGSRGERERSVESNHSGRRGDQRDLSDRERDRTDRDRGDRRKADEREAGRRSSRDSKDPYDGKRSRGDARLVAESVAAGRRKDEPAPAPIIRDNRPPPTAGPFATKRRADDRADDTGRRSGAGGSRSSRDKTPVESAARAPTPEAEKSSFSIRGRSGTGRPAPASSNTAASSSLSSTAASSYRPSTSNDDPSRSTSSRSRRAEPDVPPSRGQPYRDDPPSSSSARKRGAPADVRGDLYAPTAPTSNRDAHGPGNGSNSVPIDEERSKRARHGESSSSSRRREEPSRSSSYSQRERERDRTRYGRR